MMPLSVMRSITLTFSAYEAAAAALSPDSIALMIFFIAVRKVERSAALCKLTFTDWRARLRACAVFAMCTVS